MNDRQLLKIPCEVYSRVVGYLRPTQNWNDGKRQEFVDRKTFNVDSVTTTKFVVDNDLLQGNK